MGQVAKIIRTILKMSLELTYRIWITLYNDIFSQTCFNYVSNYNQIVSYLQRKKGLYNKLLSSDANWFVIFEVVVSIPTR